jgi:hypothetical protein
MKKSRSLLVAAARRLVVVLGLWQIAFASHVLAQPARQGLERRFAEVVQPLLTTYCVGCHGDQKPEAKLTLSGYSSAASVVQDFRIWELVRRRLEAEEMPPDDAPRRPTPHERRALIAWIEDIRKAEAERTAGDPGPVLARRLSNAEFDYTIRDLTGVDIRPTREFPVDPANEAGFDNTGQSLTMSPTLLKKHLAAARHVADHVVLKPDGFVFAPHPVVTETDRDKYCVLRIIDFYQRHAVDLADYFLASWRFQHRSAVGQPQAELRDFAAEAGLSPKYLTIVWNLLTEPQPTSGPLAVVRKEWNVLPAPRKDGTPTHFVGAQEPTTECGQLRDLVLKMRSALTPEVPKLHVQGISDGSQPFVLWKNRQSAALHMKYAGDAAADADRLAKLYGESEPEIAACFAIDKSDKRAVKQLAASFERFCHDFPDAFVVSDRGPYFDPKQAGKGRHLTAGFHLMQGYFRDDEPLCELVLDKDQRRDLDELWQELNFVTLVPQRQYKDFIFFERAEPPRFMREAEFDFARSEDKDATSAVKMRRLADLHLARAQRIGAGDDALEAIRVYYQNIEAEIRWVEQTRLAAEERHLAQLARFAQRAYRRPVTTVEREELLSFYRALRAKEGLGHDEAIRDSLATILLSPHFSYRVDLAAAGSGIRPLTDQALARRLSYFLWSSLPDDELMARAAAGDLHQPDVLGRQTRRMLRDPRARGLAVEFMGNWLDFRRFDEHNSVDRQRFPSFTSELRQAMFEEPVRFTLDMLEHNRSVLDLVDGRHTFVNQTLARHYGMPFPEAPAGQWVRMDDADKYGRGGLLPMAVFLTKNAPGLRTSPVKRGYWVVRRLLGEYIPAPPATVPELPKDEANLGELTLPQLLARHRADKNCAACHQKFDFLGLPFEGYGPIGERRNRDLGGKPVQTVATYPDGSDRDGLPGLRRYVAEQRRADFMDNFCRKLFSYALGRSLILPDEKTIEQMKTHAAADDYAIESLIESIVTSPQFLNQRERDFP